MTKKRAQTIELSGNIAVSLTTFSRAVRLSRDKVGRLLAEAGVAPAAKVRNYDVFNLADCIRAMITTQTGQLDPERLDAHARSAYWKSENEKLRHQAAARNLVPRLEVEREFFRIVEVPARFMQTLPDVLERDCGLPGAAIERVETALGQLGEAIAVELKRSTLAPEASAAAEAAPA